MTFLAKYIILLKVLKQEKKRDIEQQQVKANVRSK